MSTALYLRYSGIAILEIRKYRACQPDLRERPVANRRVHRPNRHGQQSDEEVCSCQGCDVEVGGSSKSSVVFHHVEHDTLACGGFGERRMISYALKTYKYNRCV